MKKRESKGRKRIKVKNLLYTLQPTSAGIWSWIYIYVYHEREIPLQKEKKSLQFAQEFSERSGKGESRGHLTRQKSVSYRFFYLFLYFLGAVHT